MRIGLSLALGLGFAVTLVMSGSSAAFAQETPPAAPPSDGGLPPPKVVRTTTTVETGRKVEEEDPTSDHEKVVGHIGVGYLGFTNVRISAGDGTAGDYTNIPAPTVGVRWWLSEKLGLDLGVGLAITGGSTETVQGNTTTTVDSPGVFGLVFHGGVPFVFAHQKHMKFLVVPEVNVGFATRTVDAPAGQTNLGDTTLNGFHFDAGGRIGTEIHFGFIGIPQLSLQATVGLLLSRDAWKAKQDVGNQTNSQSAGVTAFGTTVQGAPWAIFANNISAIYYLP